MSKRFVFGPDDEYASTTEKSSGLVVVLKQDFDSAGYFPNCLIPFSVCPGSGS
jgi:hypothetical protein